MRTACFALVLCYLQTATPFNTLPVGAPARRAPTCASSSSARATVLSLSHCAGEEASSNHGHQLPVTRQLPQWRQVLQQRWRGVLGAVTVCSATMLMRVPGAGPEPAFAASTTATTTKTVKKTASTKAMKRKKAQKQGNGAVGTLVMIGGVGYWAWSSAAKEDEEEQERIKEETEKMDRLAKEFTDIDEGVTADADLLASLKERMGKSNATKTDGDDDITGSDDGSGPGGAPTMDSGGGAAVLEPPPEDVEAPDLPAQADIDRLNKLFGMGDADK